MNSKVVRTFYGELVKELTLLKRYYVNTAFRILGFYLLFGMLFFGGQAIAPTEVGNSLEALVVGFFLWTIVSSAYMATSNDITREAQWGTLEQLYLSPMGLSKVLLMKSIVNVLISLSMGSVVFFMMVVTTGAELSLNLLPVSMLVIFALAPAVGIGLFLGGLTLIYKRIGSVASILQFVFATLIAAPVEQHPAIKYLPLTLPSSLLQRSVKNGIEFWNLPMAEVALAFVVAVAYLSVGFATLHYLQRVARSRSDLSHY